MKTHFIKLYWDQEMFPTEKQSKFQISNKNINTRLTKTCFIAVLLIFLHRLWFSAIDNLAGFFFSLDNFFTSKT